MVRSISRSAAAIAGHLEAHVEAFFHPQVAHGVVEGFARHVERPDAPIFAASSRR